MSAVATTPKTALGAFVLGRPSLTALSADLKKRTITLQLPPGAAAKGGSYLLLGEEEAHSALAADQSIVTFPEGSSGMHVHVIPGLGDLAIELWAAGRSITVYYQRGSEPDRYVNHPGTWWGSERRTDAEGRDWSRSLERMVMDDFGYLVEVPR